MNFHLVKIYFLLIFNFSNFCFSQITVEAVTALPPYASAVTPLPGFVAFSFPEDECFTFIKELGQKDQCLSSRLNEKHYNAIDNNIECYTQQMLEHVKCDGTDTSSSNTVSWISEVFEGFSNQFEESKNDDGLNGETSGYQLAIGSSLINIFERNKNSNLPIIYKMRHTGTEDHVWLIEQLASNGGYRIYQSYFDGYSLKAWLSTSLDGLFASNDISALENLKAQIDDELRELGLTINSKFETLDIEEGFKKYLIYVRDYDEKMAVETFKKSWEIFGKGQVIDYNKLSIWLQGTSEMSTFYSVNDNTANLMNEQIWNKWKDLYGAPNTFNFPNLPSNFFAVFDEYRFEVKTVVIKNLSLCRYNACNIRQTL